MIHEDLPGFSGSPWLYTTPTTDIVAWSKPRLLVLFCFNAEV